MFVPAAGAYARPHRDAKQENIGAEKGRHRPCAAQYEHDAGGKTHHGDKSDHQRQPPRGQWPVRLRERVEENALASMSAKQIWPTGRGKNREARRSGTHSALILARLGDASASGDSFGSVQPTILLSQIQGQGSPLDCGLPLCGGLYGIYPAAPMIFGGTPMVAPPWIAKIERTRIGQGANRGAAHTADHRAGSGIAGERADRRAGAGAQKAAGDRTVSWCGSAGAERERCNECRRGGHSFRTFHQPFSSPFEGFRFENGGL